MQHAHDARNTGAADVTVPARAAPAWDEGVAQLAAPLVADGTAFSVAAEATAVDARTGSERWRVELEGTADHTPALLDDRLVVAAETRLVALARDDGSELWSRPLPRPARGGPTVAADQSLLAVPVAETGLVAFDAGTGEESWRAPMLGARRPAIADGRVYAAGYKRDGDTGVLRGLAATDGTRQWETELGHPDTAPVVADGGVIVADGGTLAVHDPADGTRTRTLGSVGDHVDVPPAIADGTAFVATTDGRLLARSIADGTQAWRADVHVTVDTGVSVGREAVVAAATGLPESGGPGIVALERSDGSVRWEHGIEGFDAVVSTPPVLADGAVLYASNESTGVVALGDLPPRDE
ncbi:PQQ-binding-like beta-propeller repeat protein [Haloplanus sp. GCM10025708]